MKKILYILFAVVITITIAGCKRTTGKYEIALVTDVGTISDQSFNQAAWEGVKKFGDEYGISYQYYQPTCTGAGCEVQDSDRIRAIENAIDGGAKVIVLPGYLFATFIDEIADDHPDVLFLGIDVSTSEDKDNVRGIFFKDYEAGFLAGYAVVHEGYNNLGYMGGQPVPAVIEYGVGFISGSFYAAKEKGIGTFTFPNNRYLYLNSFVPSPTHKSTAASWYTAGTEVIFVAAGGAGLSINEAALEAQKYMIGVDVDQSYLSDYVLTSAIKMMGNAVYESLVDYKNNDFASGTVLLGVKEGGSGLSSFESSKFENFTKEQYDAIVSKISDGDIVVPKNYDQLVTFLTDLGYSTGDYPTKATVEPAQ